MSAPKVATISHASALRLNHGVPIRAKEQIALAHAKLKAKLSSVPRRKSAPQASDAPSVKPVSNSTLLEAAQKLGKLEIISIWSEKAKAQVIDSAPVSNMRTEVLADRASRSYEMARGSISYDVGDVIIQDGCEYVCEMVNDCRARFVCLSRETRTITNKPTDKTVTFKAAARVLNIAPSCPSPEMILRRMTLEVLQNYATCHSIVKNNNETNRVNTMSKNTKKNTAKKDRQFPTYASLPTIGRGEAVRALKEKGVKKDEAFLQIRPKFDCSRGAFDKIWEAKPRATKADKKKSAAKAPAKKSSKSVSAKSKPAVPTRKLKATAPAKPIVPVRPVAPVAEAPAEVVNDTTGAE